MFQFKKFEIDDTHSAMKIGTDGVLIGAWAFSQYTPKNIIDVGCGSGLITLMMAQRFPNAHITGIEIDPQAALQAKLNVLKTPWHNRITIINQDFLTYTPQHPVDAIVSNPPFFTQPIKSSEQNRAIARHQETLTLANLIDHAATLLTSNGHLAFIFPSEYLDDITYTSVIAGIDPCSVTHVSSTCKAPPFRVLLEGIKGIATTHQNHHLSLRQATDNRYSDDYKNLTNRFYLDSTFN